jgi:hypothetical protein
MYVHVFPYCVVLCKQRSLGMSRSHVQGAILKCPNGFIVSEVNSETEQTRGLNQQQKENSFINVIWLMHDTSLIITHTSINREFPSRVVRLPQVFSSLCHSIFSRMRTAVTL